MVTFLQGNLPIVAGALALLLLVATRVLSKDLQLKTDLRGAVTLLVAFLVIRLPGALLEGVLSTPARKVETVLWMLAFSFGCIRAGVSYALFGWRKLTGKQNSKILRDVVDVGLYFIAALPILKSQVAIDLSSLVATSAVLSLVLGLALQDTLGNLFAGLSLQFDNPYAVGDWVTVGHHTGRVLQVTWRSTRLQTVRGERVTVPNNVVGKEAIVNFGQGSAVAIDVEVGVAYGAPPNQVRRHLLEALDEVPAVVKSPSPKVLVTQFADSSVQYVLRAWVADAALSAVVRDEILTRIWYRFSREGIELPFPQRVITTRTEIPAESDHAALLRSLDLFAPFSARERTALARSAVERRFGAGETIIEQGAQGQTFYVVVSGKVTVQTGQPARAIATLERGQYFGEMSLLTGDPRSATVVAAEDTLLLELERPAFARHFSEHPERAKQLAEALAHRRAGLSASPEPAKDEGPEVGQILGRLRQIFGLGT